jgi:prepilin-type processing-associated H-X9-DG protein
MNVILACANLLGNAILAGLAGTPIFVAALVFAATKRRTRKWIAAVSALCVLAVTGAYLWPKLSQAQLRAKRTQAQCFLKQIGLALVQYARAHEDKLPSNLDEVAGLYLGNTNPLIDPVSRQRFVYLGAGCKWGDNPDVVLAHSPHEGDGANVLFNDGHVEWLTREKLDKALQRHENSTAQ